MKLRKNMHRPRIGRAPHYGIEGLERRVLLSAATLVKDINTGTLGSNAQPIATVGTTTFFAANDGIHGSELWKTTGSGASMVADINPGPGDAFPQLFYTGGTAMGGECYFTAAYPSGTELWKSDGTASGTVPVQLINNLASNAGAGAYVFVTAGGKLYFKADDSSQHPVWWVSDGMTSGTKTLPQVSSSFSRLSLNDWVPFNNKLYFLAYDTTQYPSSESLYATDGTASGTVLIKSGLSNQDLGLTVYNGKLYFSSGTYTSDDLWASDGTAAGTSLVTSVAHITSLTPTSTGLYFSAADSNNSSKFAIWQSNGTATGTSQVLGGFDQITSGFGALPNGSVVFGEERSYTFGVYVSNGTSAGTQLLPNIEANTDRAEWTPAGNNLLFVGYVSGSSQLYATDGTVSGTHALTINPSGDANPVYLESSGSVAYFQANDGVHGRELWHSDGTQAGTQLVADVNAQGAPSYPGPFAAYNGKVYFPATEGHGREPWVSDGTAAGTYLLKDINVSGDSDPAGFVGAADKVFFYATDKYYAIALYQTDGTSAGTVPVTDSAGKTFSGSAGDATPFNNFIYFSTSDSTQGTELWRTDGTIGGTALVDGLGPGTASASPTNLTIVNGTLVFEASDGANYQVYASNGTATGTFPLTHFTGVSPPLQFAVAANGKLYFLVNNVAAGGIQFWQTDGTTAGTVMISQFEASPGSPRAITAAAGTFYLAATDPNSSNVTDLYKSDGTSGGTSFVTSLPAWISPSGFTQAGSKLFFVGHSVQYATDSALYVSDGTPGGTLPIRINPSGDAGVSDLTNVNGTLLFEANDGSRGAELWMSDGTPGGTGLLQDINFGPGGSNPSNMSVIGNTLYLSADDGIHGNELMQIRLASSISGMVFNDVNDNGILDSGEQGLPGVTVYLDLNHDGQFDSGDVSATTDAAGKYTFENLTPGFYTVREVPPSGDAQTSPTNYSTTLKLVLAQDATGVWFGNVAESSVTMNLGYFLTLTRNYGQAGTFATGDLNGDGTVNLADLLLMTRHFGKTLVVNPLIVTSTADDGSLGTLRYAITHSAAGDTITFDPTIFAPGTPHTLTLSGSQLEIPHNLTITGPGSANLSISGNNTTRVFQIDPGVTASISGLTITGGNGGSANGGAINDLGTLTLSNAVLQHNAAVHGGGLYILQGVAHVSNCTFAYNTATTYDGAVGCDTGTTATFTGCTFNNNTAVNGGGAIVGYDTSLTLINDTFVANSATGGPGGAIDNLAGTCTISNCTIVGNTSTQAGAGVYAGTSVTINNSIVAQNTAGGSPSDLAGSALNSSSAYNLIGDGSGGLSSSNHNLLGSTASLLNPKLGPLAGNGGPTQTMLPQAGSPVIDAGSNALIPTGISTDQRGYARIFNGTVDIGAVEFGATGPLMPVVSSLSQPRQVTVVRRGR